MSRYSIEAHRAAGTAPDPTAVDRAEYDRVRFLHVSPLDECAHVWDGPHQSFDDGAVWATTCSRCGLIAAAHSLRRGL